MIAVITVIIFLHEEDSRILLLLPLPRRLRDRKDLSVCLTGRDQGTLNLIIKQPAFLYNLVLLLPSCTILQVKVRKMSCLPKVWALRELFYFIFVAAPFSKTLLQSEIKVRHLMEKRQSIHGNFNFTASVWLWWLPPLAWPDSRTLSGNYVNVIDCICVWLRHDPRVSKTGSKQIQHFPTGLKILYLPVPLWQTASSTSHICSFTC